MKPNYLVIGAGKSGTTTVCELLEQHPEIYMFPHKEIHFFDQDKNYNRGFQWYESKFNPPSGVKVIGEGTPYSNGNSKHFQRIVEYLPEAKLIYIVRHPIERLESHYVQLIDNGQECESLTKAIERYSELLDTSLYWARINDFRQYYSESQILVLFIEDLYHNKKELLKKCFDFLGVDSTFQIKNIDLASNTREQKSVDLPLLKSLRKTTWFNDLKWAIPKTLTKKVKPFLRKPLKDVEIKWEEPVKEEIIAKVAEDAQKFLKAYNKPEDYWKF